MVGASQDNAVVHYGSSVVQPQASRIFSDAAFLWLSPSSNSMLLNRKTEWRQRTVREVGGWQRLMAH